MRKDKQPSKEQVKEKKQKLKKIQDEYQNSIPESERNPTHEKDFDSILAEMIKPKKKETH